MCTLTYIPIGEDGFYFTTNRDENPLREALFPVQYQLDNGEAIFPMDKVGRGTWMISHEKGFSACLLNGAFSKHDHKPPYRKSRGLMLLDLGNYSSLESFIAQYIFNGMEPFTLLVVAHLHTIKLEELRWDGLTVHYRKLDETESYIWSSSTLYNMDAKLIRKKWFTDWMKRTTILSKEHILNFHTQTKKEDLINGIVMNRNEKIKTLSVTQIKKEDSSLTMSYYDFGSNILRDIDFK